MVRMIGVTDKFHERLKEYCKTEKFIIGRKVEIIINEFLDSQSATEANT